MYCSKCGNTIKEGEAFCGNCGTPVGMTEPFADDDRTMMETEGASADDDQTMLETTGPAADDDQTVLETTGPFITNSRAMEHTEVIKESPFRETVAAADDQAYDPFYEYRYDQPDEPRKPMGRMSPGYIPGGIEFEPSAQPPQPPRRKRPKWYFPVLLISLAIISVAGGIIVASLLNSGQDPVADSNPTEPTTEETDQSWDEEESEDDGLRPEDRVYAGMGTAGENHTFASYDAAINQGARVIEQDICMSADGTLYVSYSPGEIIDYWDYEIDSRSNSPLKLEWVFDRYEHDVIYAVEIKDRRTATANTLIDLIDIYNMEHNVIVHCFDPHLLEMIKDVYPRVPTICLVDQEHYNEYVTFNEALDVDSADMVAVNYKEGMMTRKNCKAAHNADKKFVVWNADSSDCIRDAIDIGVDSYFTTHPGRALELEYEYR